MLILEGPTQHYVLMIFLNDLYEIRGVRLQVCSKNQQILQFKFLDFLLNNEGNNFFKYTKLGWPIKMSYKIKSSLF